MSDSCRVFSGYKIYDPSEAQKLLSETNNERMGASIPTLSFANPATGMPVTKGVVIDEQDFNGDGKPGEVFYVWQETGFYKEGDRLKSGRFLYFSYGCDRDLFAPSEPPIFIGNERIEQYYIADFNGDGVRDVGFQLTDGSLVLFVGSKPTQKMLAQDFLSK